MFIWPLSLLLSHDILRIILRLLALHHRPRNGVDKGLRAFELFYNYLTNPNSRARRHSSDIVIHSSSKKSKKEKDTDTESISSTTPSSSDATIVPPPPEKKCPLRFLAGIFESETEGKKPGCPLRRVQLWHTIPLCLLAIINLLVALLGLAGYRIAIGVQGFVLSLVKGDFDSYDESLVEVEGHQAEVLGKT